MNIKKKLHKPFHTRLGVPKLRSGHFGERKSSCACQEPNIFSLRTVF